MLFGTFFDAYYLGSVETTPLIGVTEDTIENIANTSYELTFLICAILIFVFIKFIRKERIIIKEQKARLGAAMFETLGQFTYVYALSRKWDISIWDDFCLQYSINNTF